MFTEGEIDMRGEMTFLKLRGKSWSVGRGGSYFNEMMKMLFF
jgi:hypothetical protein